MNIRKLATAGAAFTLAAGLTAAGATSASATEGHAPEPHIQDYVAACDVPNRTAQFVLDALGMPEDVTYTITDGTPANVVTVPAGSTARSAVFSIPASGATYSISTSAGKGWSFTAAPDCYPVEEAPVVVTPDPEPAPETPVEQPVPAPEVPVETVPVTPTPEKVTATVAWEMPKGTKPGEIKYDQAFVSITDGDQLDAVSKDLAAKSCGLFQIDVYHGTRSEIDAITVDKKLTEGEDSSLYQKHKLVEGTQCEVTPPVITPPTDTTPPVIVPPTPAVPVVPVVVEEKPQTTVEVAKVAQVKTVAQEAPEGLAYTGSESVWPATVSAFLMLALGTVLAVRARRRARI